MSEICGLKNERLDRLPEICGAGKREVRHVSRDMEADRGEICEANTVDGRIDRLPEIFGADIREFKHVTRDMKLRDER